MPAKLDGGATKGGAPRTIWFTSESDPRVVSVRSLAQDLAADGRAAHLVWNPLDGDLVQMVAATRAARLLGGEIAREGRVCVQIMVIGHARDPFTGGPLKGLPSIIAWLDSWGVLRRWPAGPPLSTPQSYQVVGSRRLWARGGHFGCSQVPDSTRPDPGGIDIRKITGPETQLAEIPRTRIPVPQVLGRRVAARPLEPVPTPEPAHTRS